MATDKSKKQWERTARLLSEWPGVIGVFDGVRRRGGEWRDERVLSVHVRVKKQLGDVPPDLRIKKRIDGVPIDIIGVGRPRLFAEVDSFDHLRAVHDGTPRPRRSAISALAVNRDGGMLALGSGHGLVPRVRSGFRTGGWSASSGKHVHVEDPSEGTKGYLIMGEVKHDTDFGVVSFPKLRPPVGLAGHMLHPGPVAWSAKHPEYRAFVQHISPRRRARVTGKLVGAGVLGRTMRFGTAPYSVTYSKLLVVSAKRGHFSKSGDSGSLVFDSSRRAIGFVVGGGKSDDGTDLTYLLTDFPGLRRELGSDLFNLFFDKEPS